MKRWMSGFLALVLSLVTVLPAAAGNGRVCSFDRWGPDPTGWSFTSQRCSHISGNWSGTNDGTYTAHMEAINKYYAPDGSLAQTEYISDKWHQTQIEDGVQHVIHRDSVQALYYGGAWHGFRALFHWVDGRTVVLKVWVDGHFVHARRR
jgi:hypothetical protein